MREEKDNRRNGVIGKSASKRGRKREREERMSEEREAQGRKRRVNEGVEGGREEGSKE